MNEEIKDFMKDIESSCENEQLHKQLLFTTADDINEFTSPTGYATVLNIKGDLNDSMVHEKQFSVLTITKIKDPNNELNDNFFNKKEELLNSCVSQFVDSPITLDVHGNNNERMDKTRWEPELGGGGHFAGVFKSRDSNERNDKYFIAVYAGVDLISKEFKSNMVEQQIELSKLEYNKQLNFAKNAAKRNANRIAYNIANCLKLDIDYTSDPYSFVEHPEFEAEAMVACPTYTQEMSSINFNNDNKTMIQTSMATYHNGLTSKDHFVLISPYDGFVQLKFDNSTNLKNKILPNSTGRKLSINQAQKTSDYNKRSVGFTWEGKSKDNEHLFKNVYNNFDKELENYFINEAQWTEYGNKVKFYPVIEKITNSHLRRKEF